MNYPSDKNKQQERKLYFKNRYLIYDIGYGEQGSEVRYSIYRYYICEGRNEEEAVKDFIRQSPFESYYLGTDNKTYFVGDGRSWLSIVSLVESSNESEEPILKW